MIVAALIVGFSFLVSRSDLSAAERIGYRVVLLAALGAWPGSSSASRASVAQRREEKHPSD